MADASSRVQDSSAVQITDADLAAFVVRQLGKHAERNDLIFELCHIAGLSWEQASRFVQQVEDQNRSRIALRQSPVLLVFAIGTFIGGLALLFISIPFLLNLAQTQSLDLLTLRRSYRMVMAFGTGLAMIAGSVLGSWQTLRAVLSR